MDCSFCQGGDAATTSVSGRADDLAYRCSSDISENWGRADDLDGRAFDISENWGVLHADGDKPIPRFYVINLLRM
jgi:hypothetical protein